MDGCRPTPVEHGRSPDTGLDDPFNLITSKKMHSPEFLGYNGQPEGVYTEQDHRYHNGQIVTYNGSYFNPS